MSFSLIIPIASDKKNMNRVCHMYSDWERMALCIAFMQL